MATERLHIQITEDGTRKVSRNIEGVADSSDKADKSLRILKRAIGAVAGAVSIRAFAQMAREVQTLDRRIRAVSGSAEEFQYNMSLVRRVSDETRTSINTNAGAFQRLSQSLTRVGATSADSAQILKTLNQAFAIGGSSATEASAAMLQLTQALSSGRLQGDELRSLTENASFLATVLADELGLDGIGALRKMGEEGKLTSEALTGALLSAGDKINSQFSKLPKTLDEAITSLKNSLTTFSNDISPIINAVTTAIDRIAQSVRIASATIDVLNAKRKVREVGETARAPTAATRGRGLPTGLIPDEIFLNRQGLPEAGGFARAPGDLIPDARNNLIQAFEARRRALQSSDEKELQLAQNRVESALEVLKRLKQAQEIQSKAESQAIKELLQAEERLQAAISGRAAPVQGSPRGGGGGEQSFGAKRLQENAAQFSRFLPSLDDIQAQFNAGSSANANNLTKEQVDVLERKRQILGEISAAEQAQQTSQAALNALLAEGAITQDQYATAMERYVKNQNDALTAGEAFIAQLKRIDTTAAGIAESLGNALVNSIGQASNAFAEFAVNGAKDIDSLRESLANTLRSLAQQILATVVQALILRAIIGPSDASQPGGLVGLIASAFSRGGRAAGGPVQAGQPVMVGERGPELLVPSQNGTVVPNHQLSQQGQIVNQNNIAVVLNPEDILNVLGSEQGQQLIIDTARQGQGAIQGG